MEVRQLRNGAAWFLLLCSACGTPAFALGGSLTSDRAPGAPASRDVVQVAKTNYESMCRSLLQKALAGQWMSGQDLRDFEKLDEVQERSQSVQSCRDFFDLHETCQAANTYIPDEDEQVDKETADRIAALLQAVDNTQGCKAILGPGKICRALRYATRAGMRLDNSLKAILPTCLDQSILDNSTELLRQGE